MQPERPTISASAGRSTILLVRVANMVLESGDTVLVFGTKLADDISFDANTTTPHLLTVNGVSYSFNQHVASQFIIGGALAATVCGSMIPTAMMQWLFDPAAPSPVCRRWHGRR